MFSAWQSQRARGEAGEKLPDVWDSVAARGIHFRRGQLTLISAGPGTGKSAFVLNYAVRAAVPTLYLSADSDSYTQLARMISVITRKTWTEAGQFILDGRLEELRADLEGLPLQWTFESSPTLEDIDLEAAAYEEVYGGYPDLIIVDNISNVRADVMDDSATAGQDAVMEYLHSMTRVTEACVVGLHHVTGTHNNGDKPIPLNGVKNQLTDKPETVLTLHKRPLDEFSDSPGRIGVSAVKNRGGKADATGWTFAELDFDGERMQITDKQGD